MLAFKWTIMELVGTLHLILTPLMEESLRKTPDWLRGCIMYVKWPKFSFFDSVHPTLTFSWVTSNKAGPQSSTKLDFDFIRSRGQLLFGITFIPTLRVIAEPYMKDVPFSKETSGVRLIDIRSIFIAERAFFSGKLLDKLLGTRERTLWLGNNGQIWKMNCLNPVQTSLPDKYEILQDHPVTLS